MKTTIKCIIGFFIAFVLLFPCVMIIDTTFTAINDIAGTSNFYGTDSTVNVSSSVNSSLSIFQTSFIIVYTIWGGSFILMLLVSYKKDQELERYNVR